MERYELCFLNILRCALKGRPLTAAAGLTEAEWDAVFRLADAHKVLPLVFEAVHALPELKDSPLLSRRKPSVFRQVMVQTRKTAEFLDLLKALEAGGVHPLVVKGLVCRQLYPQPDHRSSSDEDLWIPPEEFDACHRILTGLGLHTAVPGDEMAHAYEIPYRRENGLLYIEIHRHLFPPESRSYGDLNRFFRSARRRAVTVRVQGAPVPTLCPTDHLFYLICHAFKHFLHSGFGIRQVCDILRFAAVYGQDIDWTLIEGNCRRIRAFPFAAAIFRIGRNYLDFDPAAARMPDTWTHALVDESAMLRDLLCSGVYGSISRSRQHSSTITLEAVAAQKQGRSHSTGPLTSLFPPADRLTGRYPYLKDRPWLLPAAWASRIGTYCQEVLTTRDSSAAETLEIGRQRLELLKQYGILDE